MSIKAIAGPVARLARLAGDNLKDRIINIEKDFNTNRRSLRELYSRINNEKNELIDRKKRLKFPYVTVQQSLEKLEVLLKNVKVIEREKTRYVLKNLLLNLIL